MRMMKHRLPPRFLLSAIVVLLLSMGLRAPDTLDARIDGILNDTHAQTAFWGIYVQDLESGRVLYQRNADKALMPASNQKLLTTATALDALGRDYRYQTTLYFDGQVEGSVMRGDLILEGSGDPSFGSREVDGTNALKQWTDDLAAMGVTRIEGRIIGDDDVFDDEAYSEGWDVAYIAKESYAPAHGGLVYLDNVGEISIAATRSGRAVSVDADPPDVFQIQNQATTSGRRRGAVPRVDRRVGTNQVRIHGSAPSSYRGTVVLPVSDPTAFTLQVFEQYLRAAGIEVAASFHDIDDLEPGARPVYKQAKPLFVHASEPLAELVKIINKESNNLYAEQVFHTFAWGGAPDGGAARVKRLLSRFGAGTAGLSIRDGSGLSRKDMVTPEALGKLLAGMRTHDEYAAFEASLPEGGEPRTTLEYRLREAPIRAKTGSLEYVRALSGYTTTPDGHPLAFVILANNYTAPAYRINQVIDSIVLALSTIPAGETG